MKRVLWFSVYMRYNYDGLLIKRWALVFRRQYCYQRSGNSNSASLLDDVYGSPDWIELYNKGTTDVNLENYALSNDLNSPAKYLFPNVTLKAGEYMVVYAAKQIEGAPEDKLCTGFKLSSKGTMLILTAAGGDTLQKLKWVVPIIHGNSKGQYKQISNPTRAWQCGKLFGKCPDFRNAGKCAASNYRDFGKEYLFHH
ncbi:MAG: lamin tail domain-containing protein [Christensenellales bacterium]